jgi:hypothetical protein
MNTANDDSIVKVADSFTNGVVSAWSYSFGGEDVYYDHTDDAIATAGGATHCQVIIVAEAH